MSTPATPAPIGTTLSNAGLRCVATASRSLIGASRPDSIALRCRGEAEVIVPPDHPAIEYARTFIAMCASIGIEPRILDETQQAGPIACILLHVPECMSTMHSHSKKALINTMSQLRESLRSCYDIPAVQDWNRDVTKCWCSLPTS